MFFNNKNVKLGRIYIHQLSKFVVYTIPEFI